MAKRRSPWAQALQHHLRAKLIAGILLVVPVGVTAFVLKLLFDVLDGLLVNIAETFYSRDEDVPIGVGIALTIILVYVVGLIATNVLGRRLVRFINTCIEGVPIVKVVYSAVRQVVEAFTGTGKAKFQRVVMVDWPRPGVKSIGFVTGQVIFKGDQRLLSVYLPTTPNPTNGFLAIVPENDVVETSMSVEEGIKMMISGGIVSPDSISVNEAREEVASTGS